MDTNVPVPPPTRVGSAAISFSDFLATILKSVARAQHESNCYSAHCLSPWYIRTPVLKFFPVPNGYLPELELNIKVGIQGAVTESGEPPECMMGRGLSSLHEYMVELVGRLLRALADALQGEPRIADSEVGQRTIGLVASDVLASYLVVRFRAATEASFLTLHCSDPQVDPTRIMAVFRRETEAVLLGHPDVRLALELAPDRAEDIRAAVHRVLAEQSRDIDAKFAEGPGGAAPELMVLAGSDIGAEVTADLRVKVMMREYKWVVNVDKDHKGHEPDQSLVPVER